MRKTAIITGADGGMGTEITKAAAAAGCRTVMVCLTKESGEERRRQIAEATGNTCIKVLEADLSSMKTTAALARRILNEGAPVDLLMNNAGTLSRRFVQTDEGFEYTVAVNYLAPFLLTNMLAPLMRAGSRVVNMVSCTYAAGKIDNRFFSHGRKGSFWWIPVYSNTKLALWLFTKSLSLRLREKGVCVNAADPGIVSTPMISMGMWFDPLTDIFFRPLIKTPRQGASTAVKLLLDSDVENVTGEMFAGGKRRKLRPFYKSHPLMQPLWDATAQRLSKFME